MKQTIAMAIALLATLYLGAQATITGKILDGKGEPLFNANVLIEELQRGDATDADGTYRITDVEPGKYTLRISYIGLDPLQQQIEVTAGENAFSFQFSESSVRLDELTVKATRADERTPMTFTNLDREELSENNVAQDMPFLLQWTPSTVVTSDAGAGVGYTGIWIRGSDPTRINVTINGIPLNDAESQGVFWVNLPDFASSTDDVQIQRGVGSSTNGAGAFGATINLNTSKLRPDAYAEVNGSVGSFNTLKGNVLFGTGLLNDKFTIDGRISRINSDGFIDRASADLESFYLSAAMTSKRSMLRFNVFSGHEVTYQAWNGVPAAFVDDPELRTFNSAGTEREGEPYDNEVDDYRQTHYQLLYNNQLARDWNANIALHYTRGMGFFEQYKADENFSSYGFQPIEIGEETISNTDLIRQLWLDNHFYGTIYSLNYDNDRLDATLGGAYSRYEGGHYGEVIWAEFAPNELGDRYYENDALKTDFNIYGKVNYGFTEKLNGYLDLQFRRVGYEFLGFNNQLENVTQSVELNFFNPKVGLFYQFSDFAEAYASFAVANREPNRNDYVLSTPNNRPKPERLYNTELGWRRQWSKAALGINFYHMLYRDQLALNGQINNVGEYTRINIDRSYRLGVEIVGGLQILPKLRFDGNLTLSRNKVQEFTEFVDVYDADFNFLRQDMIVREDTDLSFSPSVIGAAELTWSVLQRDEQDLSLTLSNKYVGEQYIDNTSDPDNVIDPYFFTNARLNYNWRPGFAKEIGVTLLVQNVFDARYETNAWSYRYRFDGQTLIDQGFYPQAGINYVLGVNVGF
jgi:iron complex outermembrane receptor protein